jgi:pyruvate formate lyase activating enzyme
MLGVRLLPSRAGPAQPDESQLSEEADGA